MLIFAHRGASGYEVENTLAAMEKALSINVQAIELDVYNIEGELFVFHDRRLETKTTGRGVTHLASKDELSKVTIQQHSIPTLWQVMTLIRGRCIVNIELKGYHTAGPLVAVYPKLISELNFTNEQLLISSFNQPYLSVVKQHLPRARVAPILTGVPLHYAESVTALDAYSIHVDLHFVTHEMVQDAHQRGAKIYVYTVDNPEDIHALKGLGVDGIFSNYPDKAAIVLANCRHDNSHTTSHEKWFG
ncbi:glycerophosphodiester phosphodiesterase [Shewanella electrodiphila]|uniref:Glycerophosphodiester phosphodiesterase n=1 Tax=Shewanella electrodiphila TaxID=934143 RepID=A0ABT0KPB2_9GAMM|nr:glycerophosphodiester phosphodiesterase [Shewanella electrodiphila]MCL1045673.1 glycerophosphodiester phosphodiesterase [Shewanella electrodiphila]